MKDFVAGALIGVVVGAVVVALTTPKTGHELVTGIHDSALDEMRKMKAKHPEYYDRMMMHRHSMDHTGDCYCHSKYCSCHACSTKDCNHEDCCCHSRYCSCDDCKPKVDTPDFATPSADSAEV